MEDFLLASFMCVVFLIVIVGGILNWKVLKILKEIHPKTWEELGKPSLLANNSIQNNFQVLKFISKKQYLALGDERLNRICNFYKGYLIFSYVCVFFYLLSVLLYIGFHQR